MNINDKIYLLLTKIPRGYVTTYGAIAKYFGLPSPRMVGRIMHNNPEPEDVPCYKVVFSDGSLAPAYAFGGADKQHELLEKDGITFKKDKVDLERHLINLAVLEDQTL